MVGCPDFRSHSRYDPLKPNHFFTQYTTFTARDKFINSPLSSFYTSLRTGPRDGQVLRPIRLISFKLEVELFLILKAFGEQFRAEKLGDSVQHNSIKFSLWKTPKFNFLLNRPRRILNVELGERKKFTVCQTFENLFKVKNFDEKIAILWISLNHKLWRNRPKYSSTNVFCIVTWVEVWF